MKSTRLVDKLIPVLLEDKMFLAISKPAGVDVGGFAEGLADGRVLEVHAVARFPLAPPPLDLLVIGLGNNCLCARRYHDTKYCKHGRAERKGMEAMDGHPDSIGSDDRILTAWARTVRS